MVSLLTLPKDERPHDPPSTAFSSGPPRISGVPHGPRGHWAQSLGRTNRRDPRGSSEDCLDPHGGTRVQINLQIGQLKGVMDVLGSCVTEECLTLDLRLLDRGIVINRIATIIPCRTPRRYKNVPLEPFSRKGVSIFSIND